jgi:2-oxoglutarate dehydrogenase E2 component (dihydrolipoamide succinyltransferase)
MRVPLLMPQVTLTMTDAVIMRWLVKGGDLIGEGQAILEVETDKATVEVQSPHAGTMLELTAGENDRVQVGEPIAFMDEVGGEVDPATKTGGPAESPAATRAPALVSSLEVSRVGAPARRRISPVASKLARQHSVPVEKLEATGPGGLIIEADVRRWIERASVVASAEVRITPVGAVQDRHPQAEGQEGTEETLIPLSPLRRRIAERMLLSRTATATVTTVGEVDMGGVRALRQEVPASYTVYIVRAAALALRQFPYLNSELRGDCIVLKNEVHIGVAVSIDDALVVPVVRNTDRKRLMELGRELESLTVAARAGTLRPEQMAGGTFTVTNSGIFGSVLFTPVINYPQAAILGIGRIADTPVVRDGGIFIRPMMYLSLSYDHRIVDGAMAVRYVQEVKRLLEQPEKHLVSGLG